MAWRRDPATGEWEMVDPMTPDPMTQGMTGQESDPSLRGSALLPPSDYQPDEGSGYRNPNLRSLPDRAQPSPPDYPPDAGGYTDPDLRAPPGPVDAGMGGGYQNVDYDIIDRWVANAQANGNEIRKTAAGTFEVDPGGHIVSEMPSAYVVN